MLKLLTGMVLFFGMHSVAIVAPSFRDRLAKAKPLAWKGVYSLISIAGFLLIIAGYSESRLQPTVLYTPPAWLYWVPPVLLLPMFILALAPYFPGRISTTTRHPQLIAVKSWALAHLLVNGMLADVLLFGSFLVWGGVLRVAIKRREIPRKPPSAPASRANDAIVVILGLALYALFVLWAHSAWFGVDPVIMFRG